MRGWVRFFLAALLVLAAAAAVGVLVIRAQALPNDVCPVVWDKETCGECGMAVSEPRFAAQLQTRHGQVVNFDDPGCLFIYLLRRDPPVHAVYFHPQDGESWLDGERVGFAATHTSPMGYGLMAVPRGTPGSLSFEEALEKMRRRERRED